MESEQKEEGFSCSAAWAAAVHHHALFFTVRKKERVARVKHKESQRAQGPSVLQNAGFEKSKASFWANAEMNDGKQAAVGHFVCKGPLRLAKACLIFGRRNHKEKGLWLKCLDPQKMYQRSLGIDLEAP